MSAFTWIRDLDQRFSWSFLGFVLAVLLALFTLYDRVVADKQPHLSIEVLSNTPVLDIREDLPKLDILFDGIDIKQDALSLSIVAVRVVNDSARNILKSHYDSDDPVGIHFSPGRIIRSDLLRASNPYLKRNLSFDISTNNTVSVNDVIIESQESYVLKVLVLHPANESPAVSAVGHVAGVSEISVREPYKIPDGPNFLSRAFGGSFWIHVVRVPGYFLLLIAVVLVVVLPSVFLSEQVAKFRRRRTIEKFRTASSVDLNDSDEFIFTKYLEDEIHVLQAMRLLNDDRLLLGEVYQATKLQATQADSPTPHDPTATLFPHLLDERALVRLMPPLLDSHFVTLRDGSPAVDDHMVNTLNHFIRYLKNTNRLTEDDLDRFSFEAAINRYRLQEDSQAVLDGRASSSMESLASAVEQLVVSLSDYDAQWIPLAQLGHLLRQELPGFTPQRYGGRNLLSVLRQLESLEFEERGLGPAKAVYVRIRRGSPTVEEGQPAEGGPHPTEEEVLEQLTNTVSEAHAPDGWLFLGTLGHCLKREFPNLDYHYFGADSLLSYLTRLPQFEIEQRGEGAGASHYVRIRH